MSKTPTRQTPTAVRAMYARRTIKLRTMVQPQDVPEVRSGDELADHVLVLGNGPSHGWGVVTHQLALIGQLGEALQSLTNRPCDIDLVGAEVMNIRSALAWIGDRDLNDDDAVVLMIGFNDALRLTPVAVWKRELSDLIAGISARLRPGCSLTIVGIPPVASFSSYGRMIAGLSELHRKRLNTATSQIAQTSGLAYVDLHAPEKVGGQDVAAAVYREFAARIAARIAPELVDVRPVPTSRAPRQDKVWEWSGTPAIVEAARRGGEEKLRSLTEQAQKSFGVELAVVTLVDGDRLYHGTNTDVMPSSVPLELSFCKYTVESGETVIIPDMGRDPRFAGNPLADMSFVHFYAGYPLRAADGHVIGSFCLQGSRSRRVSNVSVDLLKDLALEAEAVLRGYETE